MEKNTLHKKFILITLLFFFVVVFFLFSNLLITNPKKINNIQFQYDSLAQKYTTIVRSEDPRSALNTLAINIEKDTFTSRYCHELAHEIGHVAYDKYQDFGETIQFDNNVCFSGYTHGVVEWQFDKNIDLKDTVKKICNSYEVDSYLSYNCYHGVGHGLMYHSDNNLLSSISMCESYGDTLKTNSCVRGIFMEYFNAKHITKKNNLSDPENILDPCFIAKDLEHKKTCHYFATKSFLEFNNLDFKKVLSWCTSINPKFTTTCQASIGAEIIRIYSNNMQKVEEICSLNSTEEILACVGGAANAWMWFTNSPEAGKQVCEKILPSEKHAACFSELKGTGLFIDN